ncbi:endonuclease/exonuclease/phosphatase family protein [uncultured Corynebacterium sp.]|uniref:endonuclease/exonuclease/phosphatase family protein n=1 Tax=uncultured Corynebacterium sp. TaxID=159447 RepID=UPI0025F0AB93|nr:endonuclease/exonuclease/phosphatase family protein [uncultured Corynebacterium sp.]
MKKHLTDYRRNLSLLILAGSLFWLSSIIWPASLTASKPYVAELQASAWVGVVIAVAAIGSLKSMRRAFIFGLIAILAATIVPRIPAFSLFQSQPMLRVMSLNTYFGGASEDEIVDAVKEVHPDVLVLAETNPLEASAVAMATGMQVMTEVEPGDGADGTTVLAREEWINRSEARAGLEENITRFQMPRVTATVSVASNKEGNSSSRRPVELYGVHALAPAGRDRGPWASEIESIARMVGKNPQKSGRNIVIAGDFNATRAHPGFRAIDLKDCTGHMAHIPTWPSKMPVIRIDHVLTSGDCTGGGTKKIAGTDHRAVWADIAFKED